MITKKILVPVVAFVLLGGGLLGVSHTYAQSDSAQFSGLAQAIAQKFNLQESDVQTVVTDWHTKQRAAMDQKMQEEMSTKLDELVKDGKITSAQKTALLAKFAEHKASFNKETMQNMTAEERKAQMDKEKSDLESWAKSQGIDLTLLPQLMGPGHGHRGGMGHGARPEQSQTTPTSTTTPTQ